MLRGLVSRVEIRLVALGILLVYVSERSCVPVLGRCDFDAVVVAVALFPIVMVVILVVVVVVCVVVVVVVAVVVML